MSYGTSLNVNGGKSSFLALRSLVNPAFFQIDFGFWSFAESMLSLCRQFTLSSQEMAMAGPRPVGGAISAGSLAGNTATLTTS